MLTEDTSDAWHSYSRPELLTAMINLRCDKEFSGSLMLKICVMLHVHY